MGFSSACNSESSRLATIAHQRMSLLIQDLLMFPRRSLLLLYVGAGRLAFRLGFEALVQPQVLVRMLTHGLFYHAVDTAGIQRLVACGIAGRSEERRVGKEGR